MKLIAFVWVILLVGIGQLANTAASEDDILNFGSGGEGGQSFKLDEQMAQKVRAIIKHFKQDDPVGLPSDMGNLIQDPMPVPNLDQTFSGTKMKFENILLHGLSKFRLSYVRVTLSDLKDNQAFDIEPGIDNGIGIGLEIDDLLVLGQYQMSAWFTRSKGNFSVNIIKVLAEAEVGFMVDDEGTLQVQEVNMDVKFGDIKMNFENLGFLGSIFQGMVNSVGGFLFDSIKPMILQQVEGKVRGELNRQARSVPQQFPNSINPVDMFLASARVYMREKELDPFTLPEYQYSSWGSFELTEGVMEGLSSIHRTGALLLQFEENIVRITLHLGAKNLKGKSKWRCGLMRGWLSKEGTLEFSIEYITALVIVGQPANLEKPTLIELIDLEIGNIAVMSDGIGTADYVIEAFFNIVPNLLRKQIIDGMEEPLREYVQAEVQKAIQIEKMIEERLP